MAAFPHSVSTGHYTTDQLEGEHCALCGQWFGLVPWPRPVEHERIDIGLTPGFDGFQTYRHVECPPKVGAAR